MEWRVTYRRLQHELESDMPVYIIIITENVCASRDDTVTVW